MSKQENFPHHPAQIYRPYNDCMNADEDGAMHKALLDLGESFLTYLVGIMFGEYKRSGEISDRLESEFYKFSSRKPSFGVFLSFMRMLSKEMSETILADKFEKDKYDSVSDFIFEFNLLKEVINQGADNEFADKVQTLRKTRQPLYNIDLVDEQKGFFSIFIQIRNIFLIFRSN